MRMMNCHFQAGLVPIVRGKPMQSLDAYVSNADGAAA
jgi:hypothetical protein